MGYLCPFCFDFVCEAGVPSWVRSLLASTVVGPSVAPGLGETPFCLLVPECFSLFGVDWRTTSWGVGDATPGFVGWEIVFAFPTA